MSTLNTGPVYGDMSHLGAAEVLVRFKENKLQDQCHRRDDTLGAKLILVNYSHPDGSWVLTYVNNDNMVMKRIAYSRESVLEITWVESVCRVIPLIPPLKVVP